MDVLEMRRQRAAKIEEARALANKAETEARDFTKEENEQFQRLEESVESLGNRIERQEKLGSYGSKPPENTAAKPDLKDDLTEEFGSRGAFLQAVADAARSPYRKIDPRLERRATGMSEGSPSDAGFLVGTDYSQDIMIPVWQTGAVTSRVRRITIGAGSNGLAMNMIAETDRTNGNRWGGIRGYWSAEGASTTLSAPKFAKFRLDLDKLTLLAYATDELLQDAAALEGVITQAAREELEFKLADGIINGSGAGMPLGILGAGVTVSVAKETNQAATTVVAENIDKMWARLPASSRANAVWLANQDVEPQLAQLSLAVGTGGVPVYLPAGGYSAAPYATLKGRPVLPIEQCATLGTVGDIILADLSQYLVIEKGGVQSASSMHVQFLTDEMTYRFIYRVNGKPWRDTAITPFKGSNTLSPFITLATRS